MMRVSSRGYDLIRGDEDCRLTSYLDVRGTWTIGWGHTGADVGPGVRWTQPEADAAFHRDIGWVEDTIADLVRVPLTQNQFDALASFIFNIGRPQFAQSTMLRRLNEYNYNAAKLQFRRWNKATIDGKLVPVAALTKRRAAEAALFSTSEVPNA